MSRRDFLSMPAPENYVAGLGRGATGFTTRSDLGPAREGPSEEQMKEMLAKRAAQLGTGAPTAYGVPEKKEEEKDEEEDRFQDPDNEVGLFSSGMNYDKDDDEADRIYQEVDEKMDKRRRARREAREQQERDDYEKNNPKIQLQFADLKRALGGVSEEEWAALPEVGDMTGKAKRAREARMANSRSYAVPDSVLQAASKSGELDTSISTDADGGMTTNLASIGAAQLSALTVRLDAASNTPSGAQTTTTSGTATTVDPKGYMTALDRKQASGEEINLEDLGKARLLLESAVKTNIHNGPGYVALARLEEMAGKTHTAKKVLQRGCELCPKSIAVWEESIRIHSQSSIHNAKIIAASAIKLIPKSIKLWQAAIDLEQTPAAKKKICRQALDYNPQSVELWKTLINLTESVSDAKLLFAKATETVPLSEELWISYARVSGPDEAPQILNRARKAIPTSWAIWIHACRLQEELGRLDTLDMIMSRAVKSLIKENSMIKREAWLEQAELAEAESCKGTAAAIVKATVGWGLDEDDDRRDVWMEDAKRSISNGRYETARAIIAHAVSHFPYSTTLRTTSANLEKHHGTTESLLSVLEHAVSACPSSESLWLMYAREMWQSDPQEARKIMGRSFEALPGNENLYIRAVQIEIDSGSFESARSFLQIARESAATDRIFMKSAVLERQLENYEEAIDLCNRGLQNWPGAWKLHAIKGQTYESLSKLKEAHETFNIGTRAAPKAPVLYILLARLQEKQGAVVKARSTLERGRQNVKNSPEILLEQVRLELRQNNLQQAQKIMAGALQEFPTSGKLWSERVLKLEQRTQRKPRALEAIKKVENDPQLFVVVARIFWSERRLDKAINWFTKAITLDSSIGDSYVYFFKFLQQHGTEEKLQELISTATMSEPKYGEIWQSVAKDPKNARKSVEEILKIAANLAE
ncbi:hypothetical protein EJ02DRAFT_435380 [Clathrospora elynae]|uniref:PRP1 splicing factor N-terminal domain-containing protein n=1 Tax=Clathrospora elynae TaxID=706981 RepID=A0A6A5SJA3_9PLEO|nr:hypothetical protein EJ02DRAFT_435380 [Clathrospora elynae]